MSYVSKVVYPSTGTPTPLSVPFPFISKSHVKLHLNGTPTTAFSWINSSTIIPNAVPPSGGVIKIQRQTPTGVRLVDFSDGSTLTAEALDISSTQMLYIVQEAYDSLVGTLGVGDDNTVDALTCRIKNLGSPLFPNDAATKGYVDSLLTNSINALDAARRADAAALRAETLIDALSQPQHVNDALITVVQPLVGAVSRTQHDKNLENVSVKDFGATGDGVARPVSDWYTAGTAAYRGYADLSAVQLEYPHVTSASDYADWAAIQAACNSGVKAVQVPDGKYVVNRSVVIDDKVLSVIGNGQESSIISMTGCTAQAVFDLKFTASLKNCFTFTGLTLTTDTRGVNEAFKLSAKLSAAPTQVNGENDTLFINNVCCRYDGSGYWLNGLHTINAGGVHTSQFKVGNHQDGQTDVNVAAIFIEATDPRVSVIRALSAIDTYGLRAYNMIKAIGLSISQGTIESIYMSVGELVGCYNGFYAKNRVGAVHFNGLHMDVLGSFIDARNAHLSMCRLDAVDWRKTYNGGTPATCPAIRLDSGEMFTVGGGSVFSGSNSSISSSDNILFEFGNAITGVAMFRVSIDNCAARNFYSVYGQFNNVVDISIGSGCTYAVIEGAVYSTNSNLELQRSCRDVFVAGTGVFTTSISETTFTIPHAKYFNTPLPCVFLQIASNVGGNIIFLEHDYDGSTPTSISFRVRWTLQGAITLRVNWFATAVASPNITA